MKLTAKQISYGGLFALFLANAGFGIYSAKTKAKEAQRNQTEILQKAPNKYNQLVEQTNQGKYVDWNKAVAEMRDSLRTDSIYTKGFKEGYRKAIDSINTTQAKETYKAVSKAIK